MALDNWSTGDAPTIDVTWAAWQYPTGSPWHLRGHTVRTTYVYSPHPDDEVIRLTPYVQVAHARGDRLVLVAATNGGASYHAVELGWTSEYEQRYRALEQDAAWGWLTRGDGEVVRLGLSDGGGEDPAFASTVRDFARLADDPGADVEHYAACSLEDYHADHQAVALGLLAARVRVLRFAAHPTDFDRRGPIYRVPEGRMPEAEAAARCYDGFARQEPLKSTWTAQIDNEYAARVLFPPPPRPGPTGR